MLQLLRCNETAAAGIIQPQPRGPIRGSDRYAFSAVTAAAGVGVRGFVRASRDENASSMDAPQKSTPATGDSASAPHWFATTHWSVVLEAGDATAPEAASALERLCRTYWLPLYSYVRRQGYAPHDAQDL